MSESKIDEAMWASLTDEERVAALLLEERDASDSEALKLARVISRWYITVGADLAEVIKAVRNYGAVQLLWDSPKIREALELLANSGTLRISADEIRGLVRDSVRLKAQHLTQRYTPDLLRRPRW